MSTWVILRSKLYGIQRDLDTQVEVGCETELVRTISALYTPSNRLLLGRWVMKYQPLGLTSSPLEPSQRQILGLRLGKIGQRSIPQQPIRYLAIRGSLVTAL